MKKNGVWICESVWVLGERMAGSFGFEGVSPGLKVVFCVSRVKRPRSRV